MFLLLAQPSSGQTQNAAKVVSTQGVVERQQPPWIPVAANTWLAVGATIRTGDQSRAVLLMLDETQLKLNSNTELQLTGVRDAPNTVFRRVALAASRSQESLVSLSQGQVWLRSRNKPANVKVTTPSVTAAIRGTEFDLRVAADGESVISVLDGSVDFGNAQGAIVVNSGEQGLARIGQAPTKIILLNPPDAVQWILAYSGAVSPRDYPFRYGTTVLARAALQSAGPNGIAAAEARHDSGDLAGAFQALSGLATLEAAELRGWILLEQNRSVEALVEFDGASADSSRTRLGQSMAAYRLGRFRDAYRVVEDSGADGRLLVQRAQLDLLAGDPAAARSALEGVSSLDPAYSQAQTLLSNVYLVQNRKDDARTAAERARTTNPNSPSALLALSFTEQSVFNLPAALRAAGQARILDPAFVQANLQYATLLFGSGETGQAERIVRDLIMASPQEAMAHSTLGLILLARGRNRDAAASLDEALRLDSTQGEPHLGLGILAMRDRRLDDAVTEFLDAATLEPGRSLYETYLGKALYELRRFDQAFAALAAAELLDPRDPSPHLYAGIFDNDLIRPGEAVRKFEESIRLNRGRAVYRSRFLLDRDLATRNVNLATAYTRLGLAEWGNLRAIKSELADASNSAAHLFLANTFLGLKGRLTAGGGELLLSRLLMPANANSFNALNNYTTLFDRPRTYWSLAGTGGTFNTGGATGGAAGGRDRLAYSVSWNYFRSDGFRPVNDDVRNLFGANLFKAALTPHSDVLFTYVHGMSDQGDHGFSIVDENNRPAARFNSNVDRVEAGFHQELRPGSDVVVYFARQTFNVKSDDPQASEFFHVSSTTDSPSNSYQVAHLLKISNFQLRYGLEVYQGSRRAITKEAFVFSRDPLDEFAFDPEVSAKDIRYRTGFAQATYSITPDLSVTSGMNYDWANHDDFFLSSARSMSRWNPNAGLIYSPTASTTFRFAVMRVLQTHYQDRVAPTQVAGFALNQNESSLTLSKSYNLGWDQQFGSRTFVRTTAYTRDRTIPLGSDCELVQCNGRLYGGGIVVNRFLTDRWTFVPQYSLTHATDLFAIRHDNEVNFGTFYVHPLGYSFHLQESYFHQHGVSQGTLVSASVMTTDASISYELPRKIGLISFGVTNLTDRRYAFIADPLIIDSRVPRRQARVQIQVNF